MQAPVANEYPDRSKLLWCAAVLAAGFLSVFSGFPKFWAPFSLATVIPAFLIGSTPINSGNLPFRYVILSIIAACPVTLFFWLWVRPISEQAKNIPFRSSILFFAVLLLSISYFSVNWNYWVRYQALLHALLMLLFNAVFAAMAFVLWLQNRFSSQASHVMTFHGVLFLWLAWCAFPYLGELP